MCLTPQKFLRYSNSFVSVPAANIFDVCHWFKMRRVTTSSIPAQMINIQTFRDWTNEMLV